MVLKIVMAALAHTLAAGAMRNALKNIWEIKNRIFTATECICTHWNAQMWSFSEILIKSVPSAWLTHSCMNGKRFRQKFAEKIFCILLFADLRISSE